jgi:hypothetical protein
MKKKIDAVKMVRQIRDDNYIRSKSLPKEKQFADIKRRSAEARKKFLAELKNSSV